MTRCAVDRFERARRVRARERRRRAAAVTAAAAVEVVAAAEVVELTIANVLAVLDGANVELNFLAGRATLAKHSMRVWQPSGQSRAVRWRRRIGVNDERLLKEQSDRNRRFQNAR